MNKDNKKKPIKSPYNKAQKSLSEANAEVVYIRKNHNDPPEKVLRQLCIPFIDGFKRNTKSDLPRAGLLLFLNGVNAGLTYAEKFHPKDLAELTFEILNEYEETGELKPQKDDA